MDTLEEMYASLMVGGTDKVQAARVDDTGAEGSLEDMYAQRVREYDDVLAANPYGCNQYGHEWRSKHGEGWKPSGSRGEEKQREKKTETPEERTKRVVVGAVKDANHALEELNKQLGKPPYDINDPRARAKVNLEHELTRTKERDTEEAAERLRKVTEGAKKALSETKEKSDSIETLTKEMRRMHEEYEKAQEAYRQARKKVFDLEDEIEKAIKNGDSEKSDQLEKEQEEARRMWREASSNAGRVSKEYIDLSARYREEKYKSEKYK